MRTLSSKLVNRGEALPLLMQLSLISIKCVCGLQVCECLGAADEVFNLTALIEENL